MVHPVGWQTSQTQGLTKTGVSEQAVSGRAALLGLWPQEALMHQRWCGRQGRQQLALHLSAEMKAREVSAQSKRAHQTQKVEDMHVVNQAISI